MGYFLNVSEKGQHLFRTVTQPDRAETLALAQRLRKAFPAWVVAMYAEDCVYRQVS